MVDQGERSGGIGDSGLDRPRTGTGYLGSGGADGHIVVARRRCRAPDAGARPAPRPRRRRAAGPGRHSGAGGRAAGAASCRVSWGAGPAAWLDACQPRRGGREEMRAWPAAAAPADHGRARRGLAAPRRSVRPACHRRADATMEPHERGAGAAPRHGGLSRAVDRRSAAPGRAEPRPTSPPGQAAASSAARARSASSSRIWRRAERDASIPPSRPGS